MWPPENKNGVSDRLSLYIQHWNKVVVDVSTRGVEEFRRKIPGALSI